MQFDKNMRLTAQSYTKVYHEQNLGLVSCILSTYQKFYKMYQNTYGRHFLSAIIYIETKLSFAKKIEYCAPLLRSYETMTPVLPQTNAPITLSI